ncbi:O-antigen ligase family protein [Mangrovimonas sp. AS39]|uniref:O-antigen ligase family protein n=1 Tax=Mangrovimonas futianensis TaxID=2895523 RepID=UPI001E49C007|nr:O-antigen ligase family protein [Mangrovimonas futianensis]MCF1190317.1 O-antigen ligase family protein [Mangrovimonas futianensis]MCF1193930.1 O-antigen ligase family protein [Mangrovimonas futianensis]
MKDFKKWEKGFGLITFLLLVSIPFGYFISSLVFGIWSIYSIVFGVRFSAFKIKRGLIPLLLFSLVTVASFFWTQDVSDTVHGIVRQIPLLLFSIAGLFLPIISNHIVNRVFRFFSYFLTVLALILIGLALIKFQTYQYYGFLFYHELLAPLEMNAIYMSYMVSFGLLFLIETMNKSRYWEVLFILILATFLFMLSSKSIISFSIVLALFLVLRKAKKVTLKVVVVFGFVMVALLLRTFVKPIQNRFKTEFKTSVTEILTTNKFSKGRAYTGLEARILQFRVFNEIINTPGEYLLGVGLDASKKQISQIHKRLNTPEIYQKYNFHNQYLQVLAELGCVGLILLILILIFGVNKAHSDMVFLSFISMTIILFLSESVIWRQRGILFFGILYILLFTKSSTFESKKSIRQV